MKINGIYLLIVLLSYASAGFSQTRNVNKLSPEKRHKTADRMINKGSYYNATDYLKALVAEHPSNKKYISRLADAYFFSRDYANAEEWYAKAVKLDGKTVTLNLYRYAESLKYNGKYKEAQSAFKQFATSKYREEKGQRFKLFAKNEVLSCDFALKNNEEVLPLKVTHLGDAVNSSYSEFAPFLLNDSTLYFSSLDSDSVIVVNPGESHPYQVKILLSKKDAYNEWSRKFELPNVNTTYESNANGTFSPDQSKFYFTRCNSNNAGGMECKIFRCMVVDGKLGEPEEVKELNRKGYTSTQPNVGYCMVGKSKMEVLYFASDRPGGKGGMDLWYSIINKDGSHRAPVNLGANVNSIRDEITPFFDNETSTLYFSSNFHYGFGGFDVFKSDGQLNKWSQPVNIGKPINSSVDDTYFSINNKTHQGFFVSNRPEGYHLTSATCCDDIYSYKLNKPMFVLKVNTYNIADNQKSEFIKVKVLARKTTPNSLVIDSSKVTIPAEKDSLVSNTLPTGYNNYMEEYMKANSSSLDVQAANNLLEEGAFELLEDNRNIFILANDKEYWIYGINENDSSKFLFSTHRLKNEIARSYIFDTSNVNSNIIHTDEVDLVLVNMFFNVDSALAAKKLEEENRLVVEDEKTYTVTRVIKEMKSDEASELRIILNYDFDDTKFIEKHSGSLDSLVALMNEYPNISIHIAAHTDNKGSESYNIDLSKRRVKSIMDYMISKGISRKRMTGKGHGETSPLVPNTNPDGSDNPENRWLNRRAEITIIDNSL
ncbi:MAG TPA: OmpA family protein [Cytophagaceae bacterium]